MMFCKSFGLVLLTIFFGGINSIMASQTLELVDEILVDKEMPKKSVETSGIAAAHLGHYLEFSRVIGIGSNCLTKAQINQYFAPDLPARETKKGHADLFDWMRICDYYSFAEALRNGLGDFFELKDFTTHYETYGSAEVVDHKTMLWNHHYNMIWRHLFDSDESKKLWSAPLDGQMTVEKLKEIFPAIKSKLDYLKKKFIAAKSQKTLYIISHYEVAGEVPPDLDALIHVRDALKQIRGGDVQFTILFLPHEKKFDGFENIIVREAKNVTFGWDGGDTARWKQILDEFKFSQNIWD